MSNRTKPGVLRRLGSLRRRWWAVIAAVVILAGAGGWYAMASGRSGDDTTRITATVSRGTYKTTVSATGTITPRRDQDLSFSSSGSSSGTVTAVEVAVGDRVKKGDVLARIDDSALLAQRDAADSQVDAARSQLAEDADASASQIAADEAALAAAQSQLAQAQQAVDEATLRAPFDGTVSAVGYAVGDQVGGTGAQGDPTGSGTTAAITVISPRSLLVEANVSASDVSRLKAGLQAEITPTGGGDAVYGTVSRVGVIATASDSGAAQFPVRIAVTGSPAGLYPGSTASVAITVKQATDVLAVPTAAVHSADDGSTYVYLVEDGKRVRTTVKLGDAYGAQTEVVSGIEEGDVVEVLSITGRRGSGGDRNGPEGGFQFPGGGEGPPSGSVPGSVPGGDLTFRSAG